MGKHGDNVTIDALVTLGLYVTEPAAVLMARSRAPQSTPISSGVAVVQRHFDMRLQHAAVVCAASALLVRCLRSAWLANTSDHSWCEYGQLEWQAQVSTHSLSSPPPLPSPPSHLLCLCKVPFAG
jgi:hypothetical protein